MRQLLELGKNTLGRLKTGKRYCEYWNWQGKDALYVKKLGYWVIRNHPRPP
jgi:hypothetical protein